MNEMPSSQFRKHYSSLTEPTLVTVNGRVLGEWVPAEAPKVPSLRTIQRWVKEDREAAPLSLPVEERREILDERKLPGGGIQARQAQRDDLLRKINRSK